jgi:hypothetical protein
MTQARLLGPLGHLQRTAVPHVHTLLPTVQATPCLAVVEVGITSTSTPDNATITPQSITVEPGSGLGLGFGCCASNQHQRDARSQSGTGNHPPVQLVGGRSCSTLWTESQCDHRHI